MNSNILNNKIIGVLNKKTEQLVRTQSISKELASRLVYCNLISDLADHIGYKLPSKSSKEDVALYRSDIDFEAILNDRGILDEIFEAIVEKSYRKCKGQFLTPSKVAQFMAAWGVSGGVESVLDPAVGPGIFLDKIAEVVGTQDCEMWGFDLDSSMVNTTSLRLSIAGFPGDKTTLLHEDFLKSHFITKKFDLIICNPPYLNFHDFDRNFDITSIEKKFGLKLSRLTNIYSLFFMQATSFIKSGGKMAFITPSEFFYTGYGEDLKKFLLKNWTIEAFVLVDFSKVVFNDVLTTAVVTLLSKNSPQNDHMVKFIRVLEWPDDNETLMEAVTHGIIDKNFITSNQIKQTDLDPSEKWQSYFEESDNSSLLQKLIPLSKIATVDRGIATGHNNYFALTQDEVKKWKIEERFLKPVITKSRKIKGYDFGSQDYKSQQLGNERAYLLYCFEEPSENLWKYIEYGESIGTHKRYLTSHRTPWYSMEKGKVAPIWAMVFSRDQMRFILNKTNCFNLTTFHGIFPYFNDEIMQKALLAYLNSDIFRDIQITKRREYGGGLHKFEPNDLEKLPVIDVTKLPAGNLEKLSSLFDELCESIRISNKNEEKIRKRIDKELQRILEIS